MRRTRLVALLCGLGILLMLPVDVAAQSSRTFPQTNRTVENAFLEFWEGRGGLDIFGLPLSPVYRNRAQRVRQIFERAIFEWHPENDQPNRVQLFRLGDETLNDLAYRDDQGMRQQSSPLLRPVMPRVCGSTAPCETFAATRHTVQGPFLTFWRERGGLEIFGYPLTEEFSLTNADGGRSTVQCFEKMILEYHTEIGGGTILLTRLGAPVWNDVRGDFTEEDNGLFRVPPSTSTEPYLTR